LRGGPRGFRPGFPCPAVLRYFGSEAVQFRLRGRYPLRRAVPCTSPTTQLCNSPIRRQANQLRPYNPATTTAAAYHVATVWALPLSLATTQGVEVSFLSSGYLDVSVPQLASSCPMYSGTSTTALPVVGFPIRRSRDQRLVSTSPRLIAAAHVLLRLLAPRHPPCALILLIEKNSLVTAMEFSRCARTESATTSYRRCGRSLKTQQRSSRSTFVLGELEPGRPKPSKLDERLPRRTPVSLERR
jgi:hypothetical protein